MDRVSMCNRVGIQYMTSNIEGGEYSYVQEAGSKERLIQALGYTPSHFKLDIRFENNNTVVLIETKQDFIELLKIKIQKCFKAIFGDINITMNLD